MASKNNKPSNLNFIQDTVFTLCTLVVLISTTVVLLTAIGSIEFPPYRKVSGGCTVLPKDIE